MHLNLKLFLLFILYSGVSIGQDCNCNKYKKQFDGLDVVLDKRDFERFELNLQEIRSTELFCIQKKWAVVIEKCLIQNELEKADSINSVFHKSITISTCAGILALFNYEQGYIYLKNNSFDSASIFLVKAKELAESVKDTLLELKTIAKLANLFNKIRQPDRAIEYDKLGINLASQDLNDEQLVQFYSNMIGHFGVGYDVSEDTKYLDSMKKYLPVSIALARKLNKKNRIAQNFSIIAGISWIEKKFNKALSYCDSALSYLDRNKDFRSLCPVYQKKCDNYIDLKNYKLALQFADSNLIYSRKDGDALMEAVAYERLYECNKLLGNPEAALNYYEKASKIRDSLRTNEITETVNNLEQKYQKAQNEKKISELNKENEIASLNVKFLAVGILAAFLIILIIIFFYRQSVLKSKFKDLETEQRLNRARMNPHFFFNALSSIHTLSMDKENFPKVSSLISQFAKIMRQSLESTYDELVTIEDEVVFLNNYLNLQRSRFPDKFDHEISVGDNIEQDELKVPGMLLQPFIENSIEHGFKNLSYKAKLSIAFSKDVDQLKVRVIDDGKGFKVDATKKEYPSRATQIITDRLFLLNKQHGSNARFEIKENEDKGISVIVYLPIIYNK